MINKTKEDEYRKPLDKTGDRHESNHNLITKRDLAILTAYTGYMFGKFQDFHGYAEEILGQPIFTHQFAEKVIVEKLHERSKKDFLELHEKLIRESEATSDQ